MLTALASVPIGCAETAIPLPSGFYACDAGDKAMIRDTLYFGRDRPMAAWFMVRSGTASSMIS
ncbi:hypothetical protein [Microvirga lotononidis]|nr:hypothetical protein [Microvirga lotononidis]